MRYLNSLYCLEGQLLRLLLEDFVQTITEEMGAPIWLSEKAQASTGIKNLHETLDALKVYQFEKKEGDYTLIREPIGKATIIIS